MSQGFRRVPRRCLAVLAAVGCALGGCPPTGGGDPSGDGSGGGGTGAGEGGAGGASGYTAAPDAGVHRLLQFKSGNPVLFAAAPNGEFIRWDGDCGGQGQECTLTFGGMTGIQDQSTTLVTGYLRCDFDGPPAHSGYSPGTAIDPRCTIVRP